MTIVNEFPPNIDKIRETFKLTGNEIFAWGNIIYNPSSDSLTPELIAHEEVHKKQQNDDPQAWWDRYLVDEKFRFEQELSAHRVEYKKFCSINKDRNRQSFFLTQISQRLSSPMYGNMITVRDAMRLIRC